MPTPSGGFSVGTHNLHDDAGTPTLFADLLSFTEAIPELVREVLAGSRHVGVFCAEQPDLVVCFDRAVFRKAGKTAYRRYVDGVAKVTPNRGTFTVPLEHRDTGQLVTFNAEHRINAAFPPYVRGEAELRSDAWRRHTAGTLSSMVRQLKRGELPVSAGDTNTPREIAAYPGFAELGRGFDRIGSSSRLTDPTYLTRKGSDHPRLRGACRFRVFGAGAR